jgi:methylated-DNA-[protein]-cysteine S-methyltransferase
MIDSVAFGRVCTGHEDIMVAVTESGVVATSFHDSPAVRQRIASRLRLPVTGNPARTAVARGELAAYFDGELHEFTVDLDWRLTSPVQRHVLATLHLSVHYGHIVSYGELAALSGINVPACEISSIMSGNPIPVIVPCHRVVAGGDLGGVDEGEGMESKRRLLILEGHLPTSFR